MTFFHENIFKFFFLKIFNGNINVHYQKSTMNYLFTEYCINFRYNSCFYIHKKFSYWLISTNYFSRSIEMYKNVIISSRDLKVHEISIYEILLPFSSWNALVLALVTSIQDMFVLKGQRLQRNAIQQT